MPELFAKNDADALAGHRGLVSRPDDTRRLVPETELVTLYGLNARGQIERLGFTGGNDYTDNGIEAENPLNLPQAKNWHGGCASLGPVLVTDSEFDDASVAVSCEILRENKRIARKTGRTGQSHLNMPDRLFHLERSLFGRLPLGEKSLQLLYWGTPIVFSEADLPSGLQVNDTVRMSFGGIGDLQNSIGPFTRNRQLAWLEANRR
ncbi:MAG: fumarylacetoacetate hydrolase family protein [Gemmatimonadetes bacterium]|nr:fumarylacetoacetate hydrolase family protein [Gemmatimonadota bacterium]